MQATIKDINKEAYQKAINEQNEQLKQLENFASSLKAKFSGKTELPPLLDNAGKKQSSILRRSLEKKVQ